MKSLMLNSAQIAERLNFRKSADDLPADADMPKLEIPDESLAAEPLTTPAPEKVDALSPQATRLRDILVELVGEEHDSSAE